MLKVTKIKPCANYVVTTMEVYSEEEVRLGKLFDTSKLNAVKEYQKVLAIGPLVRDVKVGDIVRINPSRYIQILHKAGSLKGIDKKTVTDEMHSAVDIPRETLYTKDKDGIETSQTVLIIFESDIMFIAEGEDFKPTLIAQPANIIIPPGGIIKN